MLVTNIEFSSNVSVLLAPFVNISTMLWAGL